MQPNNQTNNLNLHLDLDRHARCGFPEVVYGAGKTDTEVVAAATGIAQASGLVLVTRAADSALTALKEALPNGEVHPRSHCFLLGAPEPTAGPVAVVAAGTTDGAVAEEAALILRARGIAVTHCPDCGVAGLHRLLGHLDAIRNCVAAVAIAGMDASMPTVLAGLVNMPVIAVPTSVGYGICAGGRAALDSLLASCAPGMTVVNIDNGFGGGYAAATIAQAIAKK